MQCRGKAKTLRCESLVNVYPSVCARERVLCSRVHHGVPALTWAEETYGKSQRSGLRWRRRRRRWCARARATIISRRAPAALRKQQKQEFAGFGPTEKSQWSRIRTGSRRHYYATTHTLSIYLCKHPLTCPVVHLSIFPSGFIC